MILLSLKTSCYIYLISETASEGEGLSQIFGYTTIIKRSVNKGHPRKESVETRPS